ncbi:hypothetical protein GGX14DRAFT_570628 [Mycena pura]|uniref:Uncharacterized protein n=1 Tax=Mycena pura TaxID=153505 RepID=A0AAD6V8C1_9AGAR|nr:hypothetical protein GGX14DRAFT_570628 [Mycena pura]
MRSTGTATKGHGVDAYCAGYRETNHGSTVCMNLGEMEMWTEAINATFFGKGTPYGRAEWDQLLGHCMPSRTRRTSCSRRTLRELVDVVRRHGRCWVAQALGKVNAWPEPDTMGKVLAFWWLVFLAIVVPNERLLEFRVGEGWELLCEFLGKPVPAEAFPRVNDTQAFHQQMRAALPIGRTAAVKYVLPVLVMLMSLALYDGRIKS